MNKFIKAVKALDLTEVEQIIKTRPQYLHWHEESGKNALHYLCGFHHLPQKEETGLQILQLLITSGMDMNAEHRIMDEGCDAFTARPVWYAYAKGRNKLLYTWLLNNGANPEGCMYAIAWNNDVEAAELFTKHGAGIADSAGIDTPFLAAFNWRRFEIAQWFLKRGANVNSIDLDKNTALYYAVKRKYKPEQINLLLHYGANFKQQNKDGVSPLSLAQHNRQRNILKLFSAAGNQ